MIPPRLRDYSLSMHNSEVLGQANAITTVEHVIKLLSKHSIVIIVSDDRACSEVIGEVVADWVSRLMGNTCLHHFASCNNRDEIAAVCLVVHAAVLGYVAADVLGGLVHIHKVHVWFSPLRTGLRMVANGSFARWEPIFHHQVGIPWDTMWVCSQRSYQG
jgi:hypothetical protein